MARFHLDHNVSHRLGALLRLDGHDVVTAWTLGLSGAEDDVHLSTAADDDRVLITQNGRDFRLLHGAWLRWSAKWRVTAIHAGILIIPQSQALSDVEASREIHALVRTTALANELFEYLVGPPAGWVRDPPP